MDIDTARDCAYSLRLAADHLTKYAILAEHGMVSEVPIPLAENQLKIAAADLGFDLVPRQTPQQAHDTMLARRRAEDGADPRPLTVATCDRAADAGAPMSATEFAMFGPREAGRILGFR